MYHESTYKELKNQAYQVRLAAWEQAVDRLEAGPRFARVEAEFGRPITTLRREAEKAAERFTRLVGYARNLERELELARSEREADLAAHRLLLASCSMAEAQVEMIKAGDRLAQAETILGSAEVQARRLQGQLCAEHPDCKAFEQARKKRRAAQRRRAARLIGLIGQRPIKQVHEEAREQDLGSFSVMVRDTARMHQAWHRQAACQAARIARQMNRFEGPYIQEAPSAAEYFEPFGNLVLAFSPRGEMVARWAAAADGSAYLLPSGDGEGGQKGARALQPGRRPA